MWVSGEGQQVPRPDTRWPFWVMLGFGCIAVSVIAPLSVLLPEYWGTYAPMSFPLTILLWGIGGAGGFVLPPLLFAAQYVVASLGGMLFVATRFFAIGSFALSTIYILLSWSYGNTWQGAGYSAVMMVQSLVLFAAIFLVLRSAKRRRSYWRTAMANVLVSVGWVWGAFPYMGELP